LEGFLQRYIRLNRSLITLLNELLSKYELTYSLWQVILYIKNNGPSTLVDIANEYDVEKPTITRRVYRLEEYQFVRQITSQDRREKIIELTELGEDVYKECRKKITDLEMRIMEGIAKEEQEVIFELLPKIQDNVINKGGSTIE